MAYLVQISKYVWLLDHRLSSLSASLFELLAYFLDLFCLAILKVAIVFQALGPLLSLHAVHVAAAELLASLLRHVVQSLLIHA